MSWDDIRIKSITVPNPGYNENKGTLQNNNLLIDKLIDKTIKINIMICKRQSHETVQK